MKHGGQTKKLTIKIAMLQGCVRQASLRDLAQEILAMESFLISPLGRFLKQQPLDYTHK
jgi:hypothetical protein